MSNKTVYHIYYNKRSFEHWLTAATYIHAVQSKRTSLDNYEIVPFDIDGYNELSRQLKTNSTKADYTVIIGSDSKTNNCFGVYRARLTTDKSSINQWATYIVSPNTESTGEFNHIKSLAKHGIISLPYAVFMSSTKLTFHEDNLGLPAIIRAIEAYFRFRYNITGHLNPEYEKIINRLSEIFSLYSPSSSQAQSLFSFYDTKPLKKHMKRLMQIAKKNQAMKEFATGKLTIKPEFQFNPETCLTTGQPQKRYAEAIPLPEAKIIADMITPNVVDQKIVEFILPQFILDAAIGNGSQNMLRLKALYVDCNGADFIHDPVKYAELNNYKVDVVVEELFKPCNPDSLSYRVTWTDKGANDYLHIDDNYISNTNIPMVAVPFNMLSEDNARNILHYIFLTMGKEHATWESSRTIVNLVDDYNYRSLTDIIGYIDIGEDKFSVSRVQHGLMCHILFNQVVKGQLPDDEVSNNVEEGKEIDDGNPVVGEGDIECEVSPKSILDRIDEDKIKDCDKYKKVLAAIGIDKDALIQSIDNRVLGCPTVDWDTYMQILNINFPQIVHYRCEGIGMGSIQVPVQTQLDRVAVVDIDRMPETDRKQYRINKRNYITQITGERIYGLIEMWTENESVKHYIHLDDIDNNPLHWSGFNWARLTEEATKVLTTELNSYSTGVTRTLSGKAVDISKEVGSEVFYLFVENVPIKAYIVRSFDDVIINFISDNDQEPKSSDNEECVESKEDTDNKDVSLLPPSIPITERKKMPLNDKFETCDIASIPADIPVLDRVRIMTLQFPQFCILNHKGKPAPFAIPNVAICDLSDMDAKLVMTKVYEWISNAVIHNRKLSGVIRITKSSQEGMFRHSALYLSKSIFRPIDKAPYSKLNSPVVDAFKKYFDGAEESARMRTGGFKLDHKIMDISKDPTNCNRQLRFVDAAGGLAIGINIKINGDTASIIFS